MPTSLLAQVDSSVGGKTGIDTKQGKNLIGAFHQPSLVLADTSVLSTLPPREFRAGYAEMVKYGLLGDAAFFTWLETNWRRLRRRQRQAAKAIATSIRAKAEIVEEDELEVTGTRALLNLGHTFGHALEAFAGYSDRLLHGESIAIGMRLAFDFSVELGLCPEEDAARVARHLTRSGCQTKFAQSRAQALAGRVAALMAQDKKVKGGKLALVLVRRIGEAFVERNVTMPPSPFLGQECGRDDTGFRHYLGAILGLLIASAFFSGSETALTAASAPRCMRSTRGQPRARTVNYLLTSASVSSAPSCSATASPISRHPRSPPACSSLCSARGAWLTRRSS